MAELARSTKLVRHLPVGICGADVEQWSSVALPIAAGFDRQHRGSDWRGTGTSSVPTVGGQNFEADRRGLQILGTRWLRQSAAIPAGIAALF